MDVSRLMEVMFLLSVWSAQEIHGSNKVSDDDCRPVLSSVRIEVSPMILRVMCSTTSTTSLVVECGANIRYERLPGLCSNSDLNTDRVFLSQPLLSSTITLQLAQSGQILDTAKVALLSSDQLFNYRISVWGNRNTRFVLAIGKQCRQSSNVELVDPLEAGRGSVSSQPLPAVRANNPSLEAAQNFLQSRQKPTVASYSDTSFISDDSSWSKLESTKQVNGGKLNPHVSVDGQNVQQKEPYNYGKYETGPTIEAYRSRIVKPGLVKQTSPRNFRYRYEKEHIKEDIPKTTTESSELAKLRWMEEKRVQFEKKMKFIRNFNPDTDALSDTENIYTEEDEEPTEIDVSYLWETTELPTSIDHHRSTNDGDNEFQQENDVGVPIPFRVADIQDRYNRYYNMAQFPARSAQKVPKLLNEVAPADTRYKVLKLRLLDNSYPPVSQQSDVESRHITKDETLLPSQSVELEDHITVSPLGITQSPSASKLQGTAVTNTTTDNPRKDLQDIVYPRTNLFKEIQKSSDGSESPTVLRQSSFSQSDKPTPTYTPSPQPSSINIASSDLNYSKSSTRLMKMLTTTPETEPVTGSLQRPATTISQALPNVPTRSSGVEAGRTVFRELRTAVPVTESTSRLNLISTLKTSTAVPVTESTSRLNLISTLKTSTAVPVTESTSRLNLISTLKTSTAVPVTESTSRLNLISTLKTSTAVPVTGRTSRLNLISTLKTSTAVPVTESTSRLNLISTLKTSTAVPVTGRTSRLNLISTLKTSTAVPVTESTSRLNLISTLKTSTAVPVTGRTSRLNFTAQLRTTTRDNPQNIVQQELETVLIPSVLIESSGEIKSTQPSLSTNKPTLSPTTTPYATTDETTDNSVQTEPEKYISEQDTSTVSLSSNKTYVQLEESKNASNMPSTDTNLTTKSVTSQPDSQSGINPTSSSKPPSIENNFTTKSPTSLPESQSGINPTSSSKPPSTENNFTTKSPTSLPESQSGINPTSSSKPPSTENNFTTKSPTSLPESQSGMAPTSSSNPPLYHSPASLEMNLSSVQLVPIRPRYLKSDDVNPSHESSPRQHEPNKDDETIKEKKVDDDKNVSQRTTNRTSVLRISDVDLAEMMLVDNSLEDAAVSETQPSFTPSDTVSNDTTLQEKQENETNSLTPQDINTPSQTDTVQTTTTTITDPPNKTNPLEMPETSTSGGTSQASDEDLEDMEKDPTLPVVAALVIGVPAIVVLGIAVTVIYRKRLEKPAPLTRLEVAPASLDPPV